MNYNGPPLTQPSDHKGQSPQWHEKTTDAIMEQSPVLTPAPDLSTGQFGNGPKAKSAVFLSLFVLHCAAYECDFYHFYQMLTDRWVQRMTCVVLLTVGHAWLEAPVGIVGNRRQGTRAADWLPATSTRSACQAVSQSDAAVHPPPSPQTMADQTPSQRIYNPHPWHTHTHILATLTSPSQRICNPCPRKSIRTHSTHISTSSISLHFISNMSASTSHHRNVCLHHCN